MRTVAQPRLWLLRAMALGFGLGLLILAEILVRALVPGSDDAFVDLSRFSLFTRSQENGVSYVKITHAYAYPERATRFTTDKGPETLRIFVLGASAAAGWPHPPNQTFTRYLQDSLQLANPERKIEVINAAAHGFPSYRVRQVFDEIIEFDPDAILIYSGNNEFLEGRRYREHALSSARGLLQRSRLVQLSQRLLPNHTHLSGEKLNELAAAMWSKVQRQAVGLRSDPTQFRAVQDHYRASLSHMVSAAQDRQIPVLLLTVPSNLRDWLPTVSRPIPPTVNTDWQLAFNRGRKALLQRRSGVAVESLAQAIQLAPRHAESHFWLGRALEADGHRGEALESFRAAKDQDLNPFRAISAFNTILRDLASQEGVGLVDLELRLEQQARGAAPGFDLFLDYVHPTVAGNQSIAETVHEALSIELALNPSGEPLRRVITDYDENHDYVVLMKSLGMALVNHQYVASVARAHAIESLIRQPTTQALGVPESPPAVVVEAIAALTPWIQLEQSLLLGETLPAEQVDRIRSNYSAFYHEWFRYGEF